MNGFHVCWDHNTDVCNVLAETFEFGNSVGDRKKAWAVLIGDLGGDVRPYLANARKEFGVGKRAVDKLFTNARKHKVGYDRKNGQCSFKTQGGVEIRIHILGRTGVRVDVQFNRNSTSYATELAYKLGADSIVLAHAAAEHANGDFRNKTKLEILSPENLKLCKNCSDILWS